MNALVLIRHASTELNEADRFQGSSDPPLSELGRRQARRIRKRVSSSVERIGKVWTSDLRRARETARLAFPDLPRPMDPRLRELDFGAFEERTYEENRARHGDAFLAWLEAPGQGAPPGGESLGRLRRRLRSWIDDRGEEAESVAVTHGGPVRMMLSILTGVEFVRLRWTTIEPATPIRLERECGSWKLAPVPDDGEPVEAEDLRRILKEEQ